MQVHVNLPISVKSQKPKPEVELRCRGRGLEKKIWRHNSVADGPISTKFGRQMQSDMYAEAGPVQMYMSPEQQILMKKLDSLQHRF